jgi:hypothetical protein
VVVGVYRQPSTACRRLPATPSVRSRQAVFHVVVGAWWCETNQPKPTTPTWRVVSIKVHYFSPHLPPPTPRRGIPSDERVRFDSSRSRSPRSLPPVVRSGILLIGRTTFSKSLSRPSCDCLSNAVVRSRFSRAKQATKVSFVDLNYTKSDTRSTWNSS